MKAKLCNVETSRTVYIEGLKVSIYVAGLETGPSISMIREN
ncbi:hypothetical protein [Lysinibacillus boronitolerans]|nr:hypothetical protein [Lysinibacillus boronitolerans]